MSGIVGAFHFDRTTRIDPSVLERCHGAIAPWGAQGGSTVNVPGCGMGQTRRASDDPHGDGHPFWDTEHRIVAVVDADLQRRPQLRTSLEQSGHRFRSETQAELIVAAYRQWGVGCVEHLRGAFAFAIFDRRAHTLYVARDRLGVRPLFIFQDRNRFCFASGVRGLLAHGGVPRVLDPEAVDDFLTFGFVPGARTLLREVRALPPGSAIYADRQHVRTWSYWQPKFRPERELNLEQQAQALLTAVQDAVEAPGDGSIVALSGGLGAAVVSAAAAQRWPTPIRAASVAWEANDEGEPAAEVARRIQASHVLLASPPVSAADWQATAEDSDLPFDAPLMAWFTLGRALAGHGAVAWTGAGSSIVFGGAKYRASLLRQRMADGLKRGWIRSLGPERRLFGSSKDAAGGDRLEARFARKAGDRAHRAWYTQDFLRGLRGYEGVARWEGIGADGAALSRLQSLDLRYSVASGLLPTFERVEQLTGLRWRHPLLDAPLVDFAGRLPERYRLDVDHDRVILRRAARRLFPPQVIQRLPKDVIPPTVAWLRGPLRPVMEALFFNRTGSGLFDTGALRQAWYRLMLGSRSPAVGLWRVAALEAWARSAL